MVFKLNRICVAISLSGLSVLAFADHDETEIVVSASRSATPLAETPASVSVVRRQEIDETKPGYIHQVLNQMAGVHMIDLGNEQHTMSIRLPITTSAFYQYLEDGVPIRPIGLFNHNALLETNLDGAGRIEVLRGPASSLYGSNAVGGAVNFLSHGPAAETESLVGFRGTEDGYYRVDAGFSDTYGSTGVRASYYQSRNEGSWRQHNDYRKESATVRVDQALGESGVWRNVLTWNDLQTDMPGSLTKDQFEKTPELSYQTFTYRGDTSLRLNSTFETDWTPDRRTAVTVYLRDGSVAQNPSYSISSAPGTADRNGRINLSEYRSLGADVRWREDFSKANVRVIGGVSYDRSPTSYWEDVIRVHRSPDLQFTSYDQGGFINVITGKDCSPSPTLPACQTVKRRRDYDALITNPSAYLQTEYSPFDALHVVAGIRYDLIRYDYSNNIYDASTPGFGPASEKRDFEHLSPKLGAVLSLNDDMQLYSNLSQGFVPPEISQLYGALSIPDLREATYNNVDLGLRVKDADRRWQWEAALYRLQGRNEVVSYNPCLPSCSVSSSSPVNAGRTRHQGLEFSFSTDPALRFGLRSSLTFSRHKYVDYRVNPTTSYSGNEMPMAPDFVGNAEVFWRPTHQARIGLESQHVADYFMDETNANTYQGHTLWNLRSEYKKGALELYMQALNLFDKRYSTMSTVSFGTATYTPGDPRTLILGFNWRIGTGL